MDNLSEVVAYIGAFTGILSLILYYVRIRRENAKLIIKLNENKRHGILFRYPLINTVDELGNQISDKENPINVGLMSIQIINKSSFPISIASVEAFCDGKTKVHDEMPILQINENSSLGFRSSEYLKLPLNMPAYETREVYICVDINKDKIISPKRIQLRFVTSRGKFNGRIQLTKFVYS